MVNEYLRVGEEKKRSTDELLMLTGIEDKRALRKQIAKERLDGHLILSSVKGGYFLPATKEEIEKYTQTITREALSMLKGLKYCKLKLKELDCNGDINNDSKRSI